MCPQDEGPHLPQARAVRGPGARVGGLCGQGAPSAARGSPDNGEVRLYLFLPL